ncbi:MULTISPECIES: AI-2E family transporter [unclassified Enterococcus]|uniref:AI-2E family transporter n=1 Tax=unclassified Enterococcus TaxID=2608891 RepID=UPI0015559218|nr:MULTISPECIES: AI-2E family transporter [unclassified Enterococcus]MBS7575930.1 AI-2E family transporter [Enterococcus sp. MMGLQ5-2]MBS7583163.1 AI-2E family transporter [Enterococcus sp. MMGLQ5-1]NPD11023.1 AI-2E family transporter [Enterococcus sp. MMGLQ5-1]NPD35766.1 AI-2E family transporter [Enterococcus sp. MMGLQ5-2]
MDKKSGNTWISFLGGKATIFSLLILLLFSGVILMFTKISFIFVPLVVILQVIIPPIILTLVLYYILKPVIYYLEKIGFHRTLAIIIVLLLCIFILITLFIVLIPLLLEQIERLIINFPNYLREVDQIIERLLQDSRFQGPITSVMEIFSDWLNQVSTNSGEYLKNIALGATTVFSSVTSALLLFLTVPIFTFFLLKNDQKFYSYFIELLPPKFRKDGNELLQTMDNQVGAYLKGRFIVSVIIGSLTFVGFLIIQMPFSGALSVIVGLTAIIPYIGPFAAFIPCAIIALMVSPELLLQMCIVWVIVQLLNGELIEPQVMGKHMVIHPVTIIFVLWIMGDLLGIVGLIFGIPIYAIGKVIIVFSFRKFKSRYNRFYGQKDCEYVQTEFTKEDYTGKS